MINFNLIKFIWTVFLELKAPIIFKKYSLLTLSFLASVPQVFGYSAFKGFLMNKINNEEAILMITLWVLYSLAIFFISLIDISSGLLKSKILKIPFSSQRFIVGLFKLVVYQALIGFLMLFQFAAHIADWSFVVSIFMGLMFMFGLLIVLWEFRSVGDNMEAIFDKKMRVFYVLDRLIEGIETQLIDKIKSSKICKDD